MCIVSVSLCLSCLSSYIKNLLYFSQMKLTQLALLHAKNALILVNNFKILFKKYFLTKKTTEVKVFHFLMATD